MSGRMVRLLTAYVLLGLILLAGNTTQANWSETFDGDEPDLATWQFYPFPDVTKTFTNTIKVDPNGNKYLSIDETSSSAAGGSQFGVGIGSEEVFTDVRVGAEVNVTGGLRNYHGLAARVTYFIDPDGSLTGAAPGIVASTYLMLIHWQDGPANFRFEVFKTVNNLTDIMKTYHEEPVPGIGHARSYYAELDVVGSDPVYITGSLYEYKGGPLIARTPTLIDTNGNDPWENEGHHDAIYPSGVSVVFGMNQNSVPAGYHASYDSVSSVSDGPAAVNPSPADGAAAVSIDADFSWVEAKFATSRDLWFGKKGAMEKIEQSPEGASFDPGTFEFGQTYEWRVDQIGASGPVTGRTWTFTAADCMIAEDFDAYTDDADLMAAWVDNISDWDYVFLATDAGGNNSIRFELQNQFEPYFTEATRTFESPHDWTAHGIEALSLSFVGEKENNEHLMYLILEDAAGQSLKVEHPFTYACQSDTWRQWTFALGQFSDAGVDLSSVKKCTIGFGDGTSSGQAGDDRDLVFIDEINLCPAGSYDFN
ncbi:MAG: hypothetical protein H8D56_19790 [Planctomycetes bacterium]|nr:hypothetical protein [Planctomycetota bacterium]MBL7142793.1 hypothetical protein [Phycisphaerae bacterium]